jgi:hypothetical protein
MEGGRREAVFEYDELGRLTDVYLDGEHVLTSSHGPMDIDPVHASDDYSAFTATAAPVASTVFGSLDEIVYTRPFGTPYGIVRFVPEMARFVILEHPVVPPDSLLMASLRRRNLASEDALDPSPLLGFDKPSSSLFVPPEFFASNCSTCAGGAVGFDVDRVGSGPIATGQTITFEADAPYPAHCILYTMELDKLYSIPKPYVHNVSFLGGGGVGSGTYTTVTPYKQFSGYYTTPGTKTVRDTLRCSCGNIFLAQAEEDIEVCEPAQKSGYDYWSISSFQLRPGFLQSRYIFSNPAANTFRFSILPLDDELLVPNAEKSPISTSANRWDATRSMCGVTYTSVVNFDWRPPSTANVRFEYVPTLSPCGEMQATTSSAMDIVRIRCLPGDPSGPVDGLTTAHEIGHVLGFSLPHRQVGGDLMSSPPVGIRDVQAYHIRVLLDRYF